jgi:hypothetical protein
MIWHAHMERGKGSDQGDDRGETHGKREDTRKREVMGHNGAGGHIIYGGMTWKGVGQMSEDEEE